MFQTGDDFFLIEFAIKQGLEFLRFLKYLRLMLQCAKIVNTNKCILDRIFELFAEFLMNTFLSMEVKGNKKFPCSVNNKCSIHFYKWWFIFLWLKELSALVVVAAAFSSSKIAIIQLLMCRAVHPSIKYFFALVHKTFSTFYNPQNCLRMKTSTGGGCCCHTTFRFLLLWMLVVESILSVFLMSWSWRMAVVVWRSLNRLVYF